MSRRTRWRRHQPADGPTSSVVARVASPREPGESAGPDELTGTPIENRLDELWITTASRDLDALFAQHLRLLTERIAPAIERPQAASVTEDYVVSSMPDVSPTKWHLAHTSWFFETFVLAPHLASYRTPNPRYAFLFNSYYVQAGERHCRAQRGLVTRPTVRQVFAYRAHVDERLSALLQAPVRMLAHTVFVIVALTGLKLDLSWLNHRLPNRPRPGPRFPIAQ